MLRIVQKIVKHHAVERNSLQTQVKTMLNKLNLHQDKLTNLLLLSKINKKTLLKPWINLNLKIKGHVAQRNNNLIFLINQYKCLHLTDHEEHLSSSTECSQINFKRWTMTTLMLLSSMSSKQDNKNKLTQFQLMLKWQLCQ